MGAWLWGLPPDWVSILLPRAGKERQEKLQACPGERSSFFRTSWVAWVISACPWAEEGTVGEAQRQLQPPGKQGRSLCVLFMSGAQVPIPGLTVTPAV